jgi:hypothetical protein
LIGKALTTQLLSKRATLLEKNLIFSYNKTRNKLATSRFGRKGHPEACQEYKSLFIKQQISF